MQADCSVGADLSSGLLADVFRELMRGPGQQPGQLPNRCGPAVVMLSFALRTAVSRQPSRSPISHLRCNSLGGYLTGCSLSLAECLLSMSKQAVEL